MAKDKIQILADELEKNMADQDAIKVALEPLKEREEALRDELIKGMLKKGYKFIKTSTGLGFGVQERKTLSIKEGMEGIAIEWAKTNYPAALTVYKPAMNKIIKPMLHMPEFIEESITRYLSVRTTDVE